MYFFPQKAERELEEFERENYTEAKVKRMLEAERRHFHARAKVINAAATEGQRRSMYNANNQLLVT